MATEVMRDLGQIWRGVWKEQCPFTLDEENVSLLNGITQERQSW